MSLKLEKVNLNLNNKQILTSLDIEFELRKIHFIIGPSGGGKSSMLRLLNALNDPTSGKIYLDDIDYCKVHPRSLRKKVGMIFQKPALFEGTVYDNLIWGLKIQNMNINDNEIKSTLENLDIPINYLEKDIENLSIGEQQRICIVRSLLVNPEVLLFDEPVSALDPQRANKVLQLIKKINSDYNKTVFLVSHILDTALNIADMIHFIYQGEILFSGTKEELLKVENSIIKDFMEGNNE
ncbi:MAG: ATP-binding cassette domain-containing protein [Candidatus Cloacimonetes bacterium]|jgi:putative ABC transport system ATP-binding protein|nr:ATP-binding cassette domain-containing protein [Candidatus Cloacimonadota bacterium]MDD4156320.1 ATP-binding cassette domain-containing protein [Candidatus Cloacimonadota bacterium]